MHPRYTLTLALLSASLYGPVAMAQKPIAAISPAAAIDRIAHTVVLGDTLEQLSAHYFGNIRHWPQLQRDNSVRNPRRLVPGSVLYIPSKLLPTAAASVQYVRGSATQGAAATPLRAGQTLAEGDRIKTSEDAFVAVQLADGSVIRVQGQSDVQWRQLRRKGRAGSLQSVLQLHAGGVQTSVPAGQAQAPRLEIHTPSAATSVRGTEFDVQIAPDGSTRTAVLQGSVGVQSQQGDYASAQIAHGQGLQVDGSGQLGAAQTLAPAPDLSGVPTAVHDAQLLALALPPLGSLAAWQVEIAQDAAFVQVLRQGRFDQPQAAWPALADGSYHLRLRGIDAQGFAGRASVQALRVKTQPIAPLAQTPAPGAVLAQGAGLLRCTAVPGIGRYHLQVAREGDFSQPLLQADKQSECLLNLGDLPEGQYQWRAASVQERPGHSPDQGPFSPAQRFSVEKSPVMGDVHSGDDPTRAQLHWSALPGQRFRLQLSSDLQGQHVLRDVMLDAPQWQADDLPAGQYFVRLQVHTPSGLAGAFTPARSLQIAPAVRDGSGAALRTGSGAVQSQ